MSPVKISLELNICNHELFSTLQLIKIPSKFSQTLEIRRSNLFTRNFLFFINRPTGGDKGALRAIAILYFDYLSVS